MKKIEAVIRPDSLDDVMSALARNEQWRGQEYKVDLLPKVKIEVVVSDKEADEIIKTISKVAKTGAVGDGKIFLSDISDAVRIRTGERGDSALN